MSCFSRKAKNDKRKGKRSMSHFNIHYKPQLFLQYIYPSLVNFLERKLLPRDLPEIIESALVYADDLAPTANQSAPVAHLGRGTKVAAVLEQGALPPPDALRYPRVRLQPLDGRLEIAPVGCDEDDVGLRRVVFGRPCVPHPGRRVRG